MYEKWWQWYIKGITTGLSMGALIMALIALFR